MIKSLTIANPLGEFLTLELGAPEKSGFLLMGVDGLGPGKAIINTSELATADGALFSSARFPGRNIVLTLKLLPHPTIEDTRQLSYRYFPIKKRIALIIETDNRRCMTYAYVESNEPVIFSASQTTQISLICPDPYFYAFDQNTTVFSSVESSFSYEFENDSLTESLIEFGSVDLNTIRNIYYPGDIDVGVTLRVRAYGPATALVVQNALTNDIMRFDLSRIEELTGEALQAGDEIIATTNIGNKSILLLRDGEYTNVLNCLDKDSTWIMLTKGDNVFTYDAESGLMNLAFQIENQVAYEGV